MKYIQYLLCTAFLVACLACQTTEQKAAKQAQKQQQAQEQHERLSRQQARQQEEQKARERKALLGDTLTCTVSTVGQPCMNRLANPAIRSAKAFLKRKEGMLTIVFNYEPRAITGLSEEHCWKDHDGHNIVGANFLIRLFDGNGEYLNHFVTEETFFDPWWTTKLRPIEVDVILHKKWIWLKNKGNVLQYRVTTRDANFIDAVEFGFIGDSDP